MIEKLRSIAIFATVVEQGSFRAAAKDLGLAPSRVSEVVSQLEADLDVTLLYRTTRQLSLTNEGRLLHQKAQDMLAAAETGLDAISPYAKVPSGTLSVSAPAFAVQTRLMEVFANFAQAYPAVDLDFNFSDHRSDMIKDGFDLVIRAGWLEDSEFMSRKIGQSQRFLVASPDYVARAIPAEDPATLEQWDWIRFSMRPDATVLTSRSGVALSVLGKSNVTVNSAEALYELASKGLGVTAIPDHLARRGFDRGDLVHVLPDWTLQPLGLYAVWPNQSRRENLTTLFVRFLAEHESAQQ